MKLRDKNEHVPHAHDGFYCPTCDRVFTSYRDAWDHAHGSGGEENGR